MGYLVCIILALLVGVVFHPSLEAYFTADDFWHLPHLYQALSLGHTEMLWQNFCGPWVGKTTIYLFYRPITELTLALDYLLYGAKASGYHITSLLWHYVNCLLVYFVSLKILNRNDKDKSDLRRNELVSFLVAAIFAVHPSQAEAVAWVLARADLVGAFFCLLTVYLSLIYYESKNKVIYTFMLIAMLLGFGSKELCASLPGVLLVIFYSLSRSFKQTLKLVLLPFALLFIFLTIRALALGTPLGGYVGTQGYILNNSLLERIFVPYVWWKLAHPINEQFIQDASFYDNFLRYAYIVVALLIVLNIFFSRTIQKRFIQSSIYFCLVFLLILVNFQVWTVCNSMANSRIFYLLLFPLSLSIANIVVPSKTESHSPKANKILSLSAISTGILLILTFAILCNKSVLAWRSAGIKLQSLQQQIIQKLNTLPSSKRLAIVNLPHFIDGTVSLFVPDFVKGLLTPPLSAKDYWHRVICLDWDIKTVNMQNLKDLACDPNIELVLWDQKSNAIDQSLGPNLRQAELDQINYNQPLKLSKPEFFECKQWRISSNEDFYQNKKNGSNILSYRMSLPKKIQAQIGRDLILSLSVDAKSKTKHLGKDQNLLYVSFDDSFKRTNIERPPIILELPKEPRPMKIVVPLSQEKSWLAVLPQKDLRVDLPVCYRISEAQMVNSDSLKPKLAISGEVAQGSNGYFTPDNSQKLLTFNYSCAHIKGACGAMVEVSKPNCVFVIYTGTTRDIKPSEHALKTIKLNDTHGSFSIPVSEFPQPAYYQVRLAPVNADGRIISAFGDPVSMSLFSPNKN